MLPEYEERYDDFVAVVNGMGFTEKELKERIKKLDSKIEGLREQGVEDPGRFVSRRLWDEYKMYVHEHSKFVNAYRTAMGKWHDE